ncbi:MAG: transposase [Deltaproteobacteria bacterium]|nr:transposase [Deltaproteobacteria bacterium]
MAPLVAKVYELQRLRCNLCGQVFTAACPRGVGEQKYDETATAMIGLLKYATGLPFNRLQRPQCSLGIPLPAGTQWELVSEGSEKLRPAYKHMVIVAVNSEVLYNDDTTMRIPELQAMRDQCSDDNDEQQGRTGCLPPESSPTARGIASRYLSRVKSTREKISPTFCRGGPKN